MGGPGVDNLSVFFLAEGEQSSAAVMARLTTFIRTAKQTLDLAVYDMRFSDPLRAQLVSALRERAEAGAKHRTPPVTFEQHDWAQANDPYHALGVRSLYTIKLMVTS